MVYSNTLFDVIFVNIWTVLSIVLITAWHQCVLSPCTMMSSKPVLSSAQLSGLFSYGMWFCVNTVHVVSLERATGVQR